MAKYRKPSIKKSVSARTKGKAKRSIKGALNPTYGKKGMGWVNDPKKAMYNKVYNKTTTSIFDLYNNNSTSYNNSNSNSYNDYDNGNNSSKFGTIILGIIILIFSLPAIFIIYWVLKIVFEFL